MKQAVSMYVNGELIEDMVEPRLSLADFLRDKLRLTGTHLGCEMGVCGACLVLVDGTAAHACLLLTVQVSGEKITTIEGLSESGKISDLQEAFHSRNALQCGYCTSGMLMTAHSLLKQDPQPDRDKIRETLSGNYCRCTGYEAIVDAISATALKRQAGDQT